MKSSAMAGLFIFQVLEEIFAHPMVASFGNTQKHFHFAQVQWLEYSLPNKYDWLTVRQGCTMGGLNRLSKKSAFDFWAF